MLFDQRCTVCDTQPRKLLWAGRILPSCPPAPTLQSCAWVPRHAALWRMRCSTVSRLYWLGIHKPDCRELAGGLRCGHNPALCGRAEWGSQVATRRKTGRRAAYQQLRADRNSAESGRKYFPSFLPSSWDCRIHTKNCQLLLRDTNCVQ